MDRTADTTRAAWRLGQLDGGEDGGTRAWLGSREGNQVSVLLTLGAEAIPALARLPSLAPGPGSLCHAAHRWWRALSSLPPAELRVEPPGVGA
jgi:hypothetical protein